MSGLTARISVIAFILVLVISLGTVFVSAQTPATVTVSVTPTSTVTTTPAVISNFSFDITQTDNNANAADVKITVNIKNFDLTTQTPTGTPKTPVGLIKYSFDVPQASPGQTASPAVTQTSVPTATGNKVQALASGSFLSTETQFYFTSIAIGEHTFGVELVNQNGTSMQPRQYLEVKMSVQPEK